MGRLGEISESVALVCWLAASEESFVFHRGNIRYFQALFSERPIK